MKLKKLEKKLAKLEEKKLTKPSFKLDKKIMKLEKKKIKLEKWLKIKLPFRILITTGIIWVSIAGISYACSYIPVLKEIKVAATGAIAYAAPEPVSKALDIITLNVGTNNNDFEWLKNTIKGYLTGEIQLDTVDYDYTSDGESYTQSLGEISEEEYERIMAKQQEINNELDGLATEALGTSIDNIESMSLSEILMRVATNSTPELVSKILDATNLTTESKQRVQQDVNRALKIIPKLNNNQMSELVDLITNILQDANEQFEEVQNVVIDYNNQVEIERQELEATMQYMESLQN